jgi:hypothetical protein
MPAPVFRLLLACSAIALASCSLARDEDCVDPERFDLLPAVGQLACLESGQIDSPSGHIAFGIAHLHLLRFEAKEAGDEAVAGYIQHSEAARSAEFASPSLERDVGTLLRYYDALLSQQLGRRIGLGAGWLDSTCPHADPAGRFQCHELNLRYWHDQAWDGSRSDSESVYLAYLGLKLKYGGPEYDGIVLRSLGRIDAEAARRQYLDLSASGDVHPAIRQGYCEALDFDQAGRDARAEADCP